MLDNLTIHEVHLHLAPAKLQETLDIIVNQLRKIIMDQAALATALGGVSDSLTSVGDQLAKATAEIVTAVANAGATTPEVNAAVTKLQGLASALATAAQTLDDLNPDGTVAP